MDKRGKDALNHAKPFLDRTSKLQQKIDDDFDKYGNKIFDDKEKERQEMDQKWKNAYNENQRHLQDKTRQTQVSKKKDQEEMDFKMREVMAYNQGEEDNKRKLEEQRNIYKEVLQNQMTLNALNKFNYGKMTQVEKGINHLDLKGYKHKDTKTMHSLIPGIKNLESVGTKPLMRGAMNVMDFSDSPPQGPKGRKGQIFFSPGHRAPEPFGGNITYDHPLPHQPGIIRNHSGIMHKPGTPSRSSVNGKPMSRTDFERYKSSSMANLHRGSQTSRNTPSMTSMYNPIVRPIDGTTHNKQIFEQVPYQYKSVQY